MTFKDVLSSHVSKQVRVVTHFVTLTASEITTKVSVTMALSITVLMLKPWTHSLVRV